MCCSGGGAIDHRAHLCGVRMRLGDIGGSKATCHQFSQNRQAGEGTG